MVVRGGAAGDKGPMQIYEDNDAAWPVLSKGYLSVRVDVKRSRDDGMECRSWDSTVHGIARTMKTVLYTVFVS